MVISLIRKMSLVLIFLILINLSGCGNEKTVDERLNWKTYTYQKIKFIFPSGHPKEKELPDLSKKYITSIRKACVLLNIDVPDDTLFIYFYNDSEQGRAMTGQKYTFAVSDTIHLWLPSFYGTSLMRYLIPKWQPDEPKHQFLKHGLIALLDNSGQNYHQVTLDFVDNDKFIPLTELAVDTTIDVNRERRQTSQAASFVDFIIYRYGLKHLNLLYTSQLDFDQAVQLIFNIPVDSMQTLWLNVIREAIKK